MGLSKLDAKCRTCPFSVKCDNKRMEAHGYLKLPDVAAPLVESSMASLSEPVLRETMTIMIDGKSNIVYKDEIEKQLYKHLYPSLGLHYGG